MLCSRAFASASIIKEAIALLETPLSVILTISLFSHLSISIVPSLSVAGVNTAKMPHAPKSWSNVTEQAPSSRKYGDTAPRSQKNTSQTLLTPPVHGKLFEKRNERALSGQRSEAAHFSRVVPHTLPERVRSVS